MFVFLWQYVNDDFTFCFFSTGLEDESGGYERSRCLPPLATIPNTSTAVLSIRTHFLNYDLHHAASLSSLESLFLH